MLCLCGEAHQYLMQRPLTKAWFLCFACLRDAHVGTMIMPTDCDRRESEPDMTASGFSTYMYIIRTMMP